MERSYFVIFILSLGVIHEALQTDAAASSQISSRLDVSNAFWHNETCEDVCACLMGIMESMRTAQICLEVSGYPCNLIKQLTRLATTRNCSVTVVGNWFECDKGWTECVGGGYMSVDIDDEANCTTSDDGGLSDKTTYLGCETTPGRNTTMTCMLSRDGQSVGQCVNNAECLYKKVNKTDPVSERVSCPANWVPYKKHCLSPINGILERNILDQRTWRGAQDYCQRRWNASLVSLDTFGEGVLKWLESSRIFSTDQEVWLGLFRDTDNSTFRWVDNTVTLQTYASWPWAEGHPTPGLNYVYILNKTLYTAESSRVNRYSCKFKVSKSLSCRPPIPTQMSLTTAMDAVGPSSSRPPTSPRTKEEESLEAFRGELTQVRDDVSNYLKTITNDTAVLKAIDSLFSFPQNKSLDTSTNTKAHDESTAIMQSLDSVVDGLAELIIGPAKPLVISTSELVLKVLTLCKECEGGEALGGQLGNQTFSLSLPDSIKAVGATLVLSTASLLHEQLPSTIEDGGKGERTAIGSLVSTIALRRWDGASIELTEDEPLKLTFSSLGELPDATPTCRYWKVTEGNKGVWSSDGCSVAKSSNNTHTTCDITHLTSFAVIMQISDSKDPLPEALDYLTWVGCALSITCLTVMLIIFLSQRMYRADRNILHMNLAVSLLLAQTIFVFGIDRTDNEGACKAVGICVHFFLLATFFWMLNEGIFLLSKTTSATTRWLRLPTYFTLGYVFPLVIVGVTMAVSFDSYDITDRCWLKLEDGGIWAFVGPAAAVILINICVLVQVIRVFLSLRANMNKKKVERIRIALRAILLTLPLLGCTWLIGMLSFSSSTIIFAYIFVILNSLQGVFIFIMYCLLNDEIKKGLRKRLAMLQTMSGRTTHTRASRTTTSGSNNAKTNRLSKSMQHGGASKL